MSPERWERIQLLFQTAKDLPHEARSLFLRRECQGDAALSDEVESLLASASQSGSFLNGPALDLAARQVAGARTHRKPGELIGPYKLLAHIATGGMGEVWRAHDTRLGRDVALKFSDARFTERFATEARVIAALNHPNICQLYDVGPDYLVMELIEGEPPAGPMALDTAFGYARQIAEALDAAHEKGVVHRDLKPANIMVRPDGTVKVLDFGIAGWGDASMESGTVLGTPAWMSPEQSRGQRVDKRADVWAFGLLLYHFLTGFNPFERSGTHETLEAVLTAEPDWNQLPLETRRLVQCCLAKDPKQRLRDVGDAWVLLNEPPLPPAKDHRWPRWVPMAAAFALGGAFLALWRLNTSHTTQSALMKLDMALEPGLSLDAAGAANLILSPDGSSFAFVSGGKLFLQSFQEGTPRQVGSVEGVNTPFYSPDGQWIAFFSQGKLRRISVNGGTAYDICPTSAYFAGGAWGVDGNIVAALTPSGPLQTVPATGGTAQPFTTLNRERRETTHRLPQFLPGGKAILFTAHNAITGFDDADIDVLTLPDRERKHLIHGGTFGRYVASGHLLYVSRGVLYAVPFDVDRTELRGEPVKVAENVVYSLYGSAQFDAAPSGTVVYRSGGTAISKVLLEQFDVRGGRHPMLSKPGTYLNPRISPDGRRVLLSERGARELTLSMLDIQRDVLRPLVEYDAATAAPWAPFAVWSPDGKFIVYRAGWDGGNSRWEWGMYWIRADSSGPPQRLTNSTLSQTPTSFSPDGRTLAFYQGAGLVGSSDIWTVSISNDGSVLQAGNPKPLVETPADENQAAFSRDGRWVAYASAGQTGPEIYVRAWPDDGRSWQISNRGGSQPLFSRTRDELYFVNPDQQLMAVSYRSAGGALVAERPRLWSERRFAELGTTFWSYDTLPGREGVVALTTPDTSDRQHGRLFVLLNAFDYLRRIAPAK